MSDEIVHSASAVETQRVGEALGRVLEPGDVLALDGELGSGKTCFVQGLARGLGVPPDERVASPTFTIVNEHFGRLTLHHIDLYRLERPDELEEIGLTEYLEAGGAAAVEWFNRFPQFKPAERIDIELEITGPESRRIRASAVGESAARRILAWREELKK
jgi:tRNA threonylcarbamoyladenosine biosynthesis protein TsaE